MVRTLVVVCCMLAVGCTTTTSTGYAERNAGGRAFWSFVIPGVGQFTNGEYGKGALMMGLNMLNNSTYMSIENADEAAEKYNTFMALGLAIGTWSAADAHKVATELNRTQPLTMPAHGRSSSSEPAPMTVVLDPFTKSAGARYCFRF